MSNIIKRVSPQELQAWNVPPDSKIDYYDGKILVVSDAEPEAPFGVAAKAGTSLLFGIAVFTHAPLVGVVCAAYAVAKVLNTVRDLYGGDNALTSRLEQDLGIVAESAPTMAPHPQEPQATSTDHKPEPLTNTADSSPIAASSPIGTATKFGAVEVPSLNMSNGSTKSFDWKRLNTDYNDFPHLFLLGKTGAGKSYVSDRLVRFLNGYAIVISPKKMPTDFQGLQVVGLPYDYRAIHRALVALERLMVDREAEMQRTGFTDFQPINVILDELPVSSSGCKDLELDLLKPLKALIRAGRTSKIRLIILAQGSEVKALGIEGEGGLRDSLTYVYLKGFVEDHAAKSKIDISQVDRPCIIDGQIADTSFLAQFKDTYAAGLDLTGQSARTKDAKWCQDKGMIPGTPEHLEKLFNLPDVPLEATGEVEEDAIETVSALAAIQSTFPNWKPKSQDIAAKIVDWMAGRPDKNFSPSEVKKSIRLLKDDISLTADRVKKLLDLLTEKQFLSCDETGRYAIAQSIQQTDDYDF